MTYDVATTWKGSFFRLDVHGPLLPQPEKMHLDRLFARELREILHGCVRAGGLKDGYVAMVCTRGVPPRGRGPALAQNRFYAYALPYVWIAPRDKQLAGIDFTSASAAISPDRSTRPSRTITGSTWCNRCSSLRARHDTSRRRRAGHVPKAGKSSRQGRHRPHRRPGVLEGVSRRTAIELCGQLGIPFRLAPLPAAALRDADEVFITSSGGGVLPIGKIDGKPSPPFPGPVTTRLYDGYWALHDDPAYSYPGTPLSRGVRGPESPPCRRGELRLELPGAVLDPDHHLAARIDAVVVARAHVVDALRADELLQALDRVAQGGAERRRSRLGLLQRLA